MKRKNKLIIFILIFNIFLFSHLKAQISNKIIVKVGGEIITSLDVQNNILTDLILNKLEINQENIDSIKGFSVKNLINKKIKRIEIKKFNIKEYNKKDLQDYLGKIAQTLDTNISGLKNIFKDNKIDFDTFSYNYETELLWNTLVFRIYSKQTNINMVEVNNEVDKLIGNLKEVEIEDLRKKISNQKKEEKLKLFSRSHFSNLENSIPVVFK
tara:strand:+ start:1267 stop:1902 length:636 start_codon:yes stop_codon:yes gene_type:complete